MKTGYVDWFDDKKGYGFIIEDGGQARYFLHYSDIQVNENGYKTVEKNRRVEFDVQENERGSKAVNVKKL